MDTKTCGRCKQIKPIDQFRSWRGKPQSYCKDCLRDYYRSYMAERRAKDPEHNLASQRDWRARNPDYQKDWNRAHPEAVRATRAKAKITSNRWLIYRYGIDRATYEEMLRLQDFRCAVCGHPPEDKPLGVDHDHTTGAVRGLLCDVCNRGLGFFLDEPGLLLRAAEYLSVGGTAKHLNLAVPPTTNGADTLA